MLVLPAVDIYEVFMQLARFKSLLVEMSPNELVRLLSYNGSSLFIIDSETARN